MRRSMSGQVVLVTGAARGIGERTARLAAARGARLALVGLEPDRLEALAGELDAVWFPCDVTDQTSLDAAVKGTVEAYGGIDVVVANAGIASRGTVAVGDIDALVRTVEVNLIGVMRTASATVAQLIASKGYLLIVASAASFTALPGMAPYCASKAGVEHFGNALRLEVAHHGVQVGTAHPSWVDTDLVRDVQDDLPGVKEALAKLPPPFGSVTSVQKCGEAFIDGIERRRRRIFVPRSVALVSWLRPLFSGRMSERVLERQSDIPAMEGQYRALGRPFGTHTAVSLPRTEQVAPEPVPEAVSLGFIADRYHRLR